MFRATAGVLLTVAATVAAPVPAPSEKELIVKHWGKPEGEGEFKLKGGRLTLRLAGADGSSELRVGRTVRGDFTAEVQVAADCPDPTKDDAREPNCNAELFVTGDGHQLQLYLMQQYNRDKGRLLDTPQRCVWLGHRYPDGREGSNLSYKKFENGLEAVRFSPVRLVRTGENLTAAYSLDAKDWDGPYNCPKEAKLPDEVTVGLFVSQTTRQKLRAEFEKFTVTPAKK